MTESPNPTFAEVGVPHLASQLPAKAEEWGLVVGLNVEIRLGPDTVVDRGIVDAVTRDGRILWLALEGPLNRRLYVKESGVEAWISG